MIEFSRLEAPDSFALEEVFRIYSDCFPPSEQQPIDLLRERINKEQNQLYVGMENNEIVFVALVWPLTHSNFVLLDYMATKPGFRGKNIGSAFLMHMKRNLEATNRYFIMEIENPVFGSNREQRQRRLNFYRKSGAKELMGFRYLLPALDGTEPTEMVLMIFPGYPEGKIQMSLVIKLVVQIYKELYGKDETDPYIQSVLNDNRANLELK